MLEGEKVSSICDLFSLISLPSQLLLEHQQLVTLHKRMFFQLPVISFVFHLVYHPLFMSFDFFEIVLFLLFYLIRISDSIFVTLLHYLPEEVIKLRMVEHDSF